MPIAPDSRRLHKAMMREVATPMGLVFPRSMSDFKPGDKVIGAQPMRCAVAERRGRSRVRRILAAVHRDAKARPLRCLRKRGGPPDA